MITNGSSVTLDNAGNPNLPNMRATVVDWFQPVTFGLLTKDVIAGQVSERIDEVETQGVVQPLKPEAVARKPEGMRSWIWLQVHAHPSFSLKTDEIIVYKGTRFRVDAKLDYTSYGYVEYHLCEAFTRTQSGV